MARARSAAARLPLRLLLDARVQHWCDFEWDPARLPRSGGHARPAQGARACRICVWINPYIAQRSTLFDEGMAKGYLLQASRWLRLAVGQVAVGHGPRRFHQPRRLRWYAGKLERLVDMGVDCFKTDFGERIPTDVVYFDGSDPEQMHNYYALLYNQLVFETLKRLRGDGEAVVFARSATVGGQQLPRALGRRQCGDLRIDGREPARRPVARPVGLRLLEPRHRRLRGHGAGPCLQALVRVRPAVVPQPSARQQLLPSAMALRRRGGRRPALLHQAQVPADALPVRRGRRGGAKRRADDARDAARVSRRSGLRDARPPVHARPVAPRRAGVQRGRAGVVLLARGALDAPVDRRGRRRRALAQGKAWLPESPALRSPEFADRLGPPRRSAGHRLRRRRSLRRLWARRTRRRERLDRRRFRERDPPTDHPP